MSRFQQRLESLGFSTYEAYLRSDHWQDVRRRYAASNLPQKCYGCDASRYQLHHRSYRRLGEERLNDLIPLCGGCHEKVHAWLKAGNAGQLYVAHKKFQSRRQAERKQRRRAERQRKAERSKRRRDKKAKKKRKPPPLKKTPMMRIKEDREETLSQVISRARATTPTHDRFEARQKLGRLHRRAVRLGDEETQAEILNSGVRPL